MSWLVSFVLTVALGLLGCYFRELWHGYLELERQLKEKRAVKVASTQTVAHVGDGSTVTLDAKTCHQIRGWMSRHIDLGTDALITETAKTLTELSANHIGDLARRFLEEHAMLERLNTALGLPAHSRVMRVSHL